MSINHNVLIVLSAHQCSSFLDQKEEKVFLYVNFKRFENEKRDVYCEGIGENGIS